MASLGCHEIHLNFDHGEGEILIFDDLYSVSVPDDKHAVAVGYYGAAYYSEDGGTSWRSGVTKTLKSLYNVSMADAKHGWAVGQRGLILRTEDGGRTWVRQPNLKEGEGTHLFGVAARDANTAWAVGEWGTRILTIDGGKNWVDYSFTVGETHPMFVWLAPFEKDKVRKGEKVYEDVALNDVYCLTAPSQKCWLIGEFGYIFYSDDGGMTWEPANIEGSAVMDQIKLGYDEIEISVDDEARLREFTDAIRSEAHLNVAIEAVANSREIQEFGRGDNPETLFEILEARTAEVREVLEDIGLPPERIRLRAQPPWDYEDYLDDDPEFLQRYLDSRRTPTGGMQVRVIQNPILFTVRFRDAGNGLIAGLGGDVLRSEDGGRNWAYRKIDRKQALFSVSSVEGGRAVTVGEKGLVRVSTDNGESWRTPGPTDIPEIFTFMRDVAFSPSGRVGFIVGQTGRIMRSTDAGIQWKNVLPPETS
jgi:photosystem II stability/assembly factor-like uncharacterized protein